MCFLCLLYKTVDDYPVVVAANRDEFYDRPGARPRQVREGVFAGIDPRAGGTWLAVNSGGAVAAVTNLHSPRPPIPDARSRGLLCLDALEAYQRLQSAGRGRAVGGRAATDLDSIVRHLLDQARYNEFNLLLADAGGAAAATWSGGRLRLRNLDRGIHIIGNTLPDRRDEPKVVRGREIIGLATRIDQAIDLLKAACKDHGRRDDRADAICIHGGKAGTLSSVVAAFHASDRRRNVYLYADGHPCTAPYRDLSALL